MSGFLNRIASSAVRTQPSAHPFVESIYPASRHEERGGPLTQYETISDASMQPREDSSELSGEAVQQDRLLQSRKAGPHKHQPRNTTDSDMLQPLVSRKSIESAAESMHSMRTSEQSETSISEAPRPDDANFSASLEYLPIVADQFVQAHLPEADNISPIRVLDEEKIASSLQHSGSRPAYPPPTAHSVTLQHDDIQIHIGRIEVVAVPQSAPRPAPAPARKGLNLDEYLSRRNGRVG